jgi:hypothetical protein
MSKLHRGHNGPDKWLWKDLERAAVGDWYELVRGNRPSAAERTGRSTVGTSVPGSPSGRSPYVKRLDYTVGVVVIIQKSVGTGGNKTNLQK